MKLVEGSNDENGSFHPPTTTQSQHALVESIASELEGVQVMANMHTDEDTARYIRRRLQEVAAAFWGDISRQ